LYFNMVAYLIKISMIFCFYFLIYLFCLVFYYKSVVFIENILYLYRKTQHNLDRNYFLSYSHKITLLLLLAAVGKLNAEFIPVTISKTELPYCSAINNQPQRCLAGVSVHLSEEGNEVAAANKLSAVQIETFAFYCNSQQYNFSIFNNNDLQSFLFRDIKLVAGWSKWAYSYSICKEYVFLTFNEVRKFYINPFKLVDGFKFIIKIPDKLIHSIISKYF